MPKQGNGAVGIGPGGEAVCVGCLSGWFLLWPKDVNMCETRTHGGRPLHCQVFSVPGKLSNTLIHVSSTSQKHFKGCEALKVGFCITIITNRCSKTELFSQESNAFGIQVVYDFRFSWGSFDIQSFWCGVVWFE